MQILSNDQINALKYIIFMSKDAGPETKKICFALIDASERFKKSVYFTSDSKDTQFEMHEMESSKGTTHLWEIFEAVGLKFRFSHHAGFFVSGGNFEKSKKKNTHTIWLSEIAYDRFASEIQKENVEKIELKDPLY